MYSNNIKNNNYIESKHILKDDVEFIRRYFKFFSYFGIFSPCLKKQSPLSKLFSKILILLLFILVSVGAAVAYFLKIDVIYKSKDIPLIVGDLVLDIMKYFSILIILNGANKDSETWKLYFKALTQVDDNLRSREFSAQFCYTLHTLKVMGYFTMVLSLYIFSSYCWKQTVLLYLQIFHRAVQFYIMVVIIFSVELMRSIYMRYMYLDREVTKIFFETKSITKEKDSEVRNIKFIYEIMNNVMEKVNAKFGPYMFFILSTLLLNLLNTFNWSFSNIMASNGGSRLELQVIDSVLDPLVYCVSKYILYIILKFKIICY